MRINVFLKEYMIPL